MKYSSYGSDTNIESSSSRPGLCLSFRPRMETVHEQYFPFQAKLS